MIFLPRKSFLKFKYHVEIQILMLNEDKVPERYYVYPVVSVSYCQSHSNNVTIMLIMSAISQNI